MDQPSLMRALAAAARTVAEPGAGEDALDLALAGLAEATGISASFALEQELQVRWPACDVDAELRSAFESHLKETKGQIDRLERVFESLGEKAQGKHCDGIAGIIEEGSAVMDEDFDDATMNACLIASGQRAEHYEMAAYGTLVAWARVLGLDDAADLLQQTLDEEKAADKKLSSLAEGGINEDAVGSPKTSGARARTARARS